ncbi:MAG TPA: hypothetical protein VJR92_12215 [Gemmatimonadaceae bacterium]|nr:hypothetical protein [Gemmatimonadaceae bacterium]
MRIRPIILSALVALIPAVSRAQYFSYPSLQPPSVAIREFNYGVASGPRTGTSLVFQWREEAGSRAHLQLDAGLNDAEGPGAGTRFIIGGGLAYRLAAASREMPLDLLLTGGIGGSFGDGTSIMRVPLGMSVGHRFVFKERIPMAITPYAHPRFSVDFCNSCSPGGGSDTNVGVDVDLGLAIDFTNNLGLRASALFAGSDFFPRDNGFGVSLVWTPLSLR